MNALLLCVVAQDTTKLTAAKLLSAMFAKYSASTATKGTITMRQSLSGVTVQVDTKVQFENPSKLYIRQDRKSSDPGTAIITSDGKYFSYNLPSEVSGSSHPKRLVETVVQRGSKLVVRDIYAITNSSLIDRSMPLDILIARPEHLRYRKSQWVTLVLSAGQNGTYVVSGTWREDDSSQPNGKFEMNLAKDGTLKRYVVRESISVDGRAPELVTTDYSVDLETNAKCAQELFKLAR